MKIRDPNFEFRASSVGFMSTEEENNTEERI